MNQADTIIAHAHKMAPLSPSAARLLEIMSQEESNRDSREVAKVVEYDAALTALVLKVINSASYSLRTPITSVERAVAYLGERMVVGIAIGSCAPEVFNCDLGGYASERGELWAHSVKTAVCARHLAYLCNQPLSPDMAFTAGLLHDIGKAVISDYLEGVTQKMVKVLDGGLVKDYLEAEEVVSGTNHCRIGSELAVHWRLPPVFQAVSLYHHHPGDSPDDYRAICYAVHLADTIAMMTGTGTGADVLGYRLDHNYTRFIMIDQGKLESLMFSVNEDFEEIKASLLQSDGKKDRE